MNRCDRYNVTCTDTTDMLDVSAAIPMHSVKNESLCDVMNYESCT